MRGWPIAGLVTSPAVVYHCHPLCHNRVGSTVLPDICRASETGKVFDLKPKIFESCPPMDAVDTKRKEPSVFQGSETEIIDLVSEHKTETQT